MASVIVSPRSSAAAWATFQNSGSIRIERILHGLLPFGGWPLAASLSVQNTSVTHPHLTASIVITEREASRSTALTRAERTWMRPARTARATQDFKRRTRGLLADSEATERRW